MKINLIDILLKERPNDSILGEEFGTHKNSNRRWILDPIDGTSEFISGSVHWGNHIALEENGNIILGIITRPALSRRWWASKNGGAFHTYSNFQEKMPIKLSQNDKLEKSRVTIWEKKLTKRVSYLKEMDIWIQPSLSNIVDFLDGKIDAFVDVVGKPWDHAPLTIITNEAGGNFQDHKGGNRIDIGEVRYTNGKITDDLFKIFDIL